MVVDLSLCHAQLTLAVDRRRADEHMDACASRRLERGGARLDISLEAPRQSSDDRPLNLLGDRLHGREVTGRAVREAGLDDIDLETCELVRDLEFVLGIERDPR